MIVLTDTRNWAEQLVATFHSDSASGRPGPRPAVPRHLERWQPLASETLAPDERELWHVTAGADSLLRAHVEVNGALAAWDYLVITDEAPGSQFDALRSLDPDSLPGSVACLAAGGRGFHGHHGRGWQTLHGNLHLSTWCNPQLEAARCGLAMTTLPAIAVLDTLDATGPWQQKPGIKWVNDILIGEAKLAGVLTATQSLRGDLSSLTLGIGLNVAVAPEVPPTPYVPSTTCIESEFAGEGSAPTCGDLLCRLLAAIALRLDTVARRGPDSMVDDYRNRNVILGKRVAIWADSSLPGQTDAASAPLAMGVVRSIDRDLSLTLEGHPDPIRCGRLALQPDGRPSEDAGNTL